MSVESNEIYDPLTRVRSNENVINMRKIREKRDWKEKRKVIGSDEASLLANEEKHIGEIKDKTLLAEKKLKTLFL